MRNIGSVEVTSSILVSSSEVIKIKAFQGNYSLKCLYFFVLSEPMILFYFLSILRWEFRGFEKKSYDYHTIY